jgi:hypothetical protein
MKAYASRKLATIWYMSLIIYVSNCQAMPDRDSCGSFDTKSLRKLS